MKRVDKIFFLYTNRRLVLKYVFIFFLEQYFKVDGPNS